MTRAASSLQNAASSILFKNSVLILSRPMSMDRSVTRLYVVRMSLQTSVKCGRPEMYRRTSWWHNVIIFRRLTTGARVVLTLRKAEMTVRVTSVALVPGLIWRVREVMTRWSLLSSAGTVNRHSTDR